jgi:hypothetical protein
VQNTAGRRHCNCMVKLTSSTRCAELYIAAHHRIGGVTTNIPKWVWLFVVPAATQGLVKYMFFGGGGAAAAPAPRPAARARPVPAVRKNA